MLLRRASAGGHTTLRIRREGLAAASNSAGYCASYTSFITGMDIDVSIEVDDNTSKEGLLRLAEMMKRMAEEDTPEDSV